MTFNEFIMITCIFLKEHNGKKLVDIIENSHSSTSNLLINLYNWALMKSGDRIYLLCDEIKYLLFYETSTKTVNYLNYTNDYHVISTVEDFMKTFKLSFKDIV